MGRYLDIVRLRAIRRGLLGGDKKWFVISAVLLSARVVQRMAQSRAEVSRFELRPGETVVIRDLRPKPE